MRLKDSSSSRGNVPGAKNRPPVLKRVGDRSVVVGEGVSITLSALDPDGDPLTWSVFGKLPPGARFSKDEGRFDWTPPGPSAPVFLTFQVSDGTDVDRETVRFTVGTDKENEPPELEPLGDRAVRAGTLFEHTLAATDPNGDQLLFGVDGALPDGATLDAPTGLFTWQIPAPLAGRTVRVRFTVSDGFLSDAIDVRFAVQDSSGGPTPPAFEPAGPFEAQVGSPLAFQLVAHDPDGQPPRFGTDGSLPEGATLEAESGRFNWVPTEEDAGIVHRIRFTATDGMLTAYLEVKIFVFLPGTAQCLDDRLEPNNVVADAVMLSTGTTDRINICDSPQSPVDVDWYFVDVPAGKQLRATLVWKPDAKPVDLVLAAIFEIEGEPTLRFVAEAEGPPGRRTVAWGPPDGGPVLVHVFGVEYEKYDVPYSLELRLEEGVAVCTPDALETGTGNDGPASATVIQPSLGETRVLDLTICPADSDWYRLPLECGQVAEVRIDFDHLAVDLDIAIFSEHVLDQPLDLSVGTVAPEAVALIPVEETGDYLVHVLGYPEQASGPYELTVTIDPDLSCADDASEPDDTPSSATILDPSGAERSGTICCSDDYYVADLQTGGSTTIKVVFGGGRAGTVEVYNPTPENLLATQTSPEVVQGLDAPQGGRAWIRVAADVGSTYTISAEGTAPVEGCTDMSCPRFEVCDPDGGCIDDICLEETDCPVGAFACLDLQCVRPCSADSECRAELGYACKYLPEGRFCVPTGERGAGGKCLWHYDCASDAACVYGDGRGFCARVGCQSDGDCAGGQMCALHAGGTVCAPPCTRDSECRTEDRFTCSAVQKADGGSGRICKPLASSP